MKKFLVLLVLCLFISVNQASFANIALETETDLKYEACLKKSKSYNQKTQCSNNAIKKYEVELNEVLAILKETLTQAQYEEFMKSQKIWEEFNKQNNSFLYKTMDNSQWDILKYPSSLIRCDNIKKRVFDLRYVIFSLNKVKEEN